MILNTYSYTCNSLGKSHYRYFGKNESMLHRKSYYSHQNNFLGMNYYNLDYNYNHSRSCNQKLFLLPLQHLAHYLTQLLPR